ncbi:MAG TPA: cation:proton antiporter, partial [Planctomycetota bacterium]|nr:cation:proton antiporter [Planctomycetota bacterium]
MKWLDKLSQVEISQELVYVFLLLGLFVVPRVLQRASVPRAITSLGLGALAAYFLPELGHDPAVILFSTLGIVSLFLFAGLEVEVRELRREARFLGLHLSVGL